MAVSVSCAWRRLMPPPRCARGGDTPERGLDLELGRQALDQPAVADSAITQSVVQAIVALLPELEGLGEEPKATPAGRQRQIAIRVPALQVADEALQPLAAVDRLALRRGQRAELAAAGAGANVRRRLLGARVLDRSLDPYLPA